MNENTNDSARPQHPTYPSPRPGDPSRVTWADYLRLLAAHIDEMIGGEPGYFVGNWVMALAEQATAFNAHTPAEHAARAQLEAEREALWLATIEAEAIDPGHWEPDPDCDPCDLGGWGGHADEATLQAHISRDPGDETYMN